jgi:FixJ family two-component response regulator
MRYETLELPTGDEHISLVDDEPALLDVELLKIRPDLPIVLNTGYSTAISNEKALEVGIKAFIYKPVVEAELAGTVRAVLDETRRE